MEMPKPTPHHEKLHVFAGDWDADEIMHPGPMGPGGRRTGRMSARVAIDGLFVLSDYEQEHDGKIVYRGHGVYGFDAQKGEHTWYWVDSMGFASVPSRGRWEGDTLVFLSHDPGHQGRYTYRWNGADEHHFSIESSFDGGATWATFMEGTYRRRASTARRPE